MGIISYFPVITEKEQLFDLVSRAAWFFCLDSIERINIPVSSEDLCHTQWRVSSGMDGSIEGNFDSLRSKVTFIVARQESDLAPCMSEADIILRWKKDVVPEYVSAATLDRWQKGKKVWQVDPVAVRMEGSFYIEVILHLLKDRDALIRENEKKFVDLANKAGRYKRAYLMATGPSVERYKHYDYTGAISIVCNSVILDEELMDCVMPKFLVFADPIFHFGPSQYAAEFRERLCASVKKYDFTICIPFKYYALFCSALPELRDRTIAIPFVKDRSFNFNLSDEFEVKTTANILTLLMTPLATTFADEICYLGCDGRPLKENTYFWSHNTKTQINDKMANIQQVHPGFFAIDYNDYYLEHCRTLEAQFQEGEKLGKYFKSLGFSHIPALAQRAAYDDHDNESVPQQSPKCRFPARVNHVLIEPDGETPSSGHYFQWHVDLARVLSRDGNPAKILTRMDAKYPKSDIAVEKTFNVRSWVLQRGEGARSPEFPYSHQVKSFLDCLEKFVDSHVDRYGAGEPLHFFMYYGSVQVVKIFIELQSKYKGFPMYFTVCLFSEVVFLDKNDPLKNYHPNAKSILSQAAMDERFRLFSVTEKSSEIMSKYFGVDIPVMAHPIMNSEQAAKSIAALSVKGGRAKEKTSLYAPCRVGHKKSSNDFFEQLQKLLCMNKNVVLKLRNAEEFRSFYESVADSSLQERITVLPDLEDADSYFKELCQADIVLIPYTEGGFYARTSGILYDTIVAKTPVIVMKGTWLADTALRLRAGLNISHLCAEHLDAAVRRISNNYDFFINNLEESSRYLLDEESFVKLAGQIVSC